MFRIKTNKIIRFLLVSDFMFYSGWGLILPVFAVYVTQEIEGGTILTVGIAEAVYLIVNSLLRVPFGIFLDSRPNEKTDYFFMTAGLFAASLVPFGYIFSTNIWHIYFFEALRAAALAMSVSGWSAIFTRHIDKGREATEWGISAMSVGIGAGICGIIGAGAIMNYGFQSVFAAVGFLGLIGAATLLSIRGDFKKFMGHGLYFSLKDLAQKVGE